VSQETPEDIRRDLRAIGFRMGLATLIVCLTAFVGFALIPEARSGFHIGGFVWLFACSVFAMVLTRPRK
jgi:hypothetical protein